MVARDRTEVAQGFNAFGCARLIAEPFRSERDSVLVTGGVNLGAVWHGVLALILAFERPAFFAGRWVHLCVCRGWSGLDGGTDLQWR